MRIHKKTRPATVTKEQAIANEHQWLTIDGVTCSFPIVKMATLNISLPAPMESFVRAQCEREYGNVSEYFRSLVREKMRQEIDADLRFLDSTRSGAAAGPSAEDEEEVLALQKRVRKDLARARRP